MNTLLALGFVLLIVIIYRPAQPASAAKKAALLVASIVAFYHLVQISFIATWLSSTIAMMISNIAYFIGLPMAMLLVLHHYFGQYYFHRQWQAATWGRLFLGLTVMFELTRRNQLSYDYWLLLTYAWLVILIVCLIVFWRQSSLLQKSAAIAGVAIPFIGLLTQTNILTSFTTPLTHINMLLVLLSLFWKADSSEHNNQDCNTD